MYLTSTAAVVASTATGGDNVAQRASTAACEGAKGRTQVGIGTNARLGGSQQHVSDTHHCSTSADGHASVAPKLFPTPIWRAHPCLAAAVKMRPCTVPSQAVLALRLPHLSLAAGIEDSHALQRPPSSHERQLPVAAARRGAAAGEVGWEGSSGAGGLEGSSGGGGPASPPAAVETRPHQQSRAPAPQAPCVSNAHAMSAGHDATMPPPLPSEKRPHPAL